MMRVCFFGDSFVNGTGDHSCLGWVGRVCKNYRARGVDLTCYNLGIRRDTSKDIAQRWEAEARARLPLGLPARLVFSFGNNDTAERENGHGLRVALEESLDTASGIFKIAQEMAPTFMIGPVPVFPEPAQNARILDCSDELAQLCKNMKVPFLSLTSLPVSFWDHWRREARAGDGVHPNFRGYENLAEVISGWELLNSSLVAPS
jgi:acyl-CoA thioesterase I